LTPTAPSSIRFTASAPLASETKTTRIGIDSANKPDVTNESDWDRAEPVIWLEGDAVSVFFVSKGGGEAIHAKFVVDDESISNNGKSAELVSDIDFDPSALDGEYTIYAFSPYASTNTLNNMTLDLSSQTQAVNADATNYSHLGKTAYMRANAGDATFANGIITGGEVNLAFDHITSFLRFHIKNGLDGFINVTDISLSHTFMSNASTYSVATGSLNSNGLNQALNLSFSSSGQPLYPNNEFDAYMSTFPVIHYGTSNILNLTVYYTDATGTQMVTYQIPQSDLVDMTETDCLFPKSSRFLFDVTINDNTITPPYPTIEDGEYIYSWTNINQDATGVVVIDGDPYVRLVDLPTICPDGWTLLNGQIIQFMSTDELENLYKTLVPPLGGVWDDDYQDIIWTETLFLYYSNDYEFHLYINGYYYGAHFDYGTRLYRPICRQLIIN